MVTNSSFHEHMSPNKKKCFCIKENNSSCSESGCQRLLRVTGSPTWLIYTCRKRCLLGQTQLYTAATPQQSSWEQSRGGNTVIQTDQQARVWPRAQTYTTGIFVCMCVWVWEWEWEETEQWPATRTIYQSVREGSHFFYLDGTLFLGESISCWKLRRWVCVFSLLSCLSKDLTITTRISLNLMPDRLHHQLFSRCSSTE